MKEKIKNYPSELKIQTLTAVPEHWPIQKTAEFFTVSEQTVNHARRLKKKKRS